MLYIHMLTVVDGLRSWRGEGWRSMEADWIAEASSPMPGASEAMLWSVASALAVGGRECWSWMSDGARYGGREVHADMLYPARSGMNSEYSPWFMHVLHHCTFIISYASAVFHVLLLSQYPSLSSFLQ